MNRNDINKTWQKLSGMVTINGHILVVAMLVVCGVHCLFFAIHTIFHFISFTSSIFVNKLSISPMTSKACFHHFQYVSCKHTNIVLNWVGCEIGIKTTRFCMAGRQTTHTHIHQAPGSQHNAGKCIAQKSIQIQLHTILYTTLKAFSSWIQAICHRTHLIIMQNIFQFIYIGNAIVLGSSISLINHLALFLVHTPSRASGKKNALQLFSAVFSIRNWNPIQLGMCECFCLMQKWPTNGNWNGYKISTTVPLKLNVYRSQIGDVCWNCVCVCVWARAPRFVVVSV